MDQISCPKLIMNSIENKHMKMEDHGIKVEPGYEYIPSQFPSREQQFYFFGHYLRACGEETVTDAALWALYREANTFALHSNFLWAVWSMFQAQASSIDFDYNVGKLFSIFLA